MTTSALPTGAPGRRVVLLTLFRKTKIREKAGYDRGTQLGLSEGDLAERLHTTIDEIERIETATELPPIAVIMRLARALDLTVDMHIAPGVEPTVTIVTPAA
ncbi:helix-turn-helix domain-containing protein [Streptomyces tirandamycinicus]|uniref:Transcriptional regulator n=1 Tax=Streptomyces tirandamycinicus TaxID=2174846 RepID=A0A2S1SST2_9ACTN|nr:helix-turn-helix transcriptional regulator [Streptomyces tirandamycinicus]AWI29475.1 transcriptional regulator [Streptomyces tirandamycinicus]